MLVLKLVLANRILKNERFRQEMDTLRILEENRIFCRHDIEHCLSVARITMLLCSERGLAADADVIYSAALLHDLGRVAEYTEGTAHELAGMHLAEEILAECDCALNQKIAILRLIAAHREIPEEQTMEYLFYLADKKSRNCFACPAQKECNWEPEKRTMEIEE